MSIRELVKRLSPKWLKDGAAERYMYNGGLAADTVLERLTQAIHARMPTKADPSALPYIGQDRLIARGLSESNANYAVRLQHAFDVWPIAGNGWAVMQQLLGYLLSKTPAIRTVSAQSDPVTGQVNTSTWNSYAAGADPTKPPTWHFEEGPGNWDWDSLSPMDGSWGWWRWWLIIYSVAPNDWVGPETQTWGSGTWGDGGVWGLDCSPAVVAGLRSIVDLWKPAGMWCHDIIVSFDATLFGPAAGSGGGVNPDGFFGRWAKVVAGSYVPARFANARYITGVV